MYDLSSSAGADAAAAAAAAAFLLLLPRVVRFSGTTASISLQQAPSSAPLPPQHPSSSPRLLMREATDWQNSVDMGSALHWSQPPGLHPEDVGAADLSGG